MAADTHLPANAASLGELAPVALISLDGQHHLSDANPAAEVLFRQSRKALCGQPLGKLLGSNSALFDLLGRVEQSGNDITAHNVPLYGSDTQDKRLCSAWVRCLEGGGFILALSEEPGRETSDIGGAVSGFGRILGHEVKNPLAGIIGAAQLLDRHNVPEQTELLGVIIDEARRIERLVTRLSVFELFSAPRPTRFNIHKLLDRILAAENAAQSGKIAYHRDYDPSLPLINADEDHLHEAIQNIMRNAAEAAEAGPRQGEVKVKTAYAAGLSMRDPRRDDKLQKAMLISIEDNGEGVPIDRQSNMFEMFNSSKSGGRGLGLSIAKEVISAHGGHIRVDTQPGQTRLSVYLPMDDGGDNAG